MCVLNSLFVPCGLLDQEALLSPDRTHCNTAVHKTQGETVSEDKGRQLINGSSSDSQVCLTSTYARCFCEDKGHKTLAVAVSSCDCLCVCVWKLPLS